MAAQIAKPTTGNASNMSAHMAFVTSALSLRNSLMIAHKSTSKMITETAIQKYVTGSVMILSARRVLGGCSDSVSPQPSYPEKAAQLI